MNSTLKKTASILLLLMLTVNSFSQTSSDIASIINTFVTNNTDGFVSWALYKSNKSITQYDTNITEGSFSPNQYRLNANLTMNGKYIFKDEVGNAGEWAISLNGPRVGADILYISSLIFYTHPTDIIDYLKKKLMMSNFKTI